MKPTQSAPATGFGNIAASLLLVVLLGSAAAGIHHAMVDTAMTAKINNGAAELLGPPR